MSCATMGLNLSKTSQGTSADFCVRERRAEIPPPSCTPTTLSANTTKIRSASRADIENIGANKPHSWDTLEESYYHLEPVEKRPALNDTTKSPPSKRISKSLPQDQPQELAEKLDIELLEIVLMRWGSCNPVLEAFKLSPHARRKWNHYAVEHLGIPRVQNGEGCELVRRELGIDDSQSAKDLLWVFATEGPGIYRVVKGEDWRTVFDSLQLERPELGADALDSNKLVLQRYDIAKRWGERIENGEDRSTVAHELGISKPVEDSCDYYYKLVQEVAKESLESHCAKVAKKFIPIYAKS